MLIFTEGKSPLFTTGKDDWETPPELFAIYHAKYHFVLDAAADQRNHKVERWFGPGGEAEDALKVSWPLDEGNVWLNPPYSKQLQQKFVRKAYWEAADKPYSVVCLLPARTDTKLFHTIIKPHAKSIELLKGRIRFINPAGSLLRGTKMNGSNNSAPFPSMIVVF